MSLTIPSFMPQCPNHREPLEGCGFPLPAKGTGKCPVSGVDFDFEAEVNEDRIAKGKNGQMENSTGWKVSGSD